MSIIGLHHAQITIPKGAEEQGRQFYCQVLGLPEIEKPDSLQGRGGFWLQVGDRQVHVGTEEVVNRRTAPQINTLPCVNPSNQTLSKIG